MMGTKVRSFAPLADDLSLEDLVPEDHFYRRLEARLDLSFVRELVGPLYANGGRPSVDPIVFFKLQLIMFFEDIRSERQLMGMVADRLSLRWYLGYDLFEPLPDHSSLTRIRERYGLSVFRRFFERIVEECIEAGLVWGEELFFDATKVEANASMESRVPRFSGEAHLGGLFGEEGAAETEARDETSEPHAEPEPDGIPRPLRGGRGKGARDPLGVGHPGGRHGEPAHARPPLQDHLPLADAYPPGHGRRQVRHQRDRSGRGEGGNTRLRLYGRFREPQPLLRGEQVRLRRRGRPLQVSTRGALAPVHPLLHREVKQVPSGPEKLQRLPPEAWVHTRRQRARSDAQLRRGATRKGQSLPRDRALREGFAQTQGVGGAHVRGDQGVARDKEV
jgi:transposase